MKLGKQTGIFGPVVDFGMVGTVVVTGLLLVVDGVEGAATSSRDVSWTGVDPAGWLGSNCSIGPPAVCKKRTWACRWVAISLVYLARGILSLWRPNATMMIHITVCYPQTLLRLMMNRLMSWLKDNQYRKSQRIKEKQKGWWKHCTNRYVANKFDVDTQTMYFVFTYLTSSLVFSAYLISILKRAFCCFVKRYRMYVFTDSMLYK